MLENLAKLRNILNQKLLLDNFSKLRPGGFEVTALMMFYKNSQDNTCVGVSFFNKVAALRPATSLKKKTLTQGFSFKFSKISMNTSFFLNMVVGLYSDIKIQRPRPPRPPKVAANLKSNL